MISVLGFAGIELWMGTLSHSLTLQADSGHMLADGIAIGMALAAAWITQRSPAKTHNTRLESWAALINGLGLLAMAGWIAREALAHLHGQPTEILSLPMLITALLGLVINSLNLYWLHGDVQQDLNVQGVFLHILADLLGSIGAILAALAVTFLQWMWADALIGALVACAIALSALPLLLQSLRHIFTAKQVLVPLSLAPESGWLEVGKTDLSRLIAK